MMAATRASGPMGELPRTSVGTRFGAVGCGEDQGGDARWLSAFGRGVSIPDTRPAVVVSVQETAASDPVEFVLTAEAGAGAPGTSSS